MPSKVRKCASCEQPLQKMEGLEDRCTNSESPRYVPLLPIRVNCELCGWEMLPELGADGKPTGWLICPGARHRKLLEVIEDVR